MRHPVDTTFQEGPKPALTVRNSISRPLSAAFGKDLEHARGTLTVTGDLDGRGLSSARRNARAARPCNHCRIRPAARGTRQAVKNRCRRVLGRDDGSARTATAARVRRKRACEIIDIGMMKLYELMKEGRIAG